MGKFYSLKNILKTDSIYNVIFGGRSNGKTYAVHEYGIQRYWKTREQMALIRRYRDDFTGKRGAQMFDNQVFSGNVKRITGGVWDEVYYWRSAWYLSKHAENGEIIRDETPFCFGFSLASMEHDKSTSYPNITTVLFDEFITRSMYLNDEFVTFMNVLSTIIRHRTNVKIFMIGNTVNKYCPYFKEMGLSHIKDMREGDIDVYRYGDSKLRVAVEYSVNRTGKESSMYFAFDNPKLSMITGSAWEIDIYPHCPVKYKPKDILLTYFIKFDDALLQCEIVSTGSHLFTFIHPKTTPIHDEDKDIIFSSAYDPRPNHTRRITRPVNDWQRRIYWFYQTDRVYYSDNEVGEVVRNYLKWCESTRT